MLDATAGRAVTNKTKLATTMIPIRTDPRHRVNLPTPSVGPSSTAHGIRSGAPATVWRVRRSEIAQHRVRATISSNPSMLTAGTLAMVPRGMEEAGGERGDGGASGRSSMTRRRAGRPLSVAIIASLLAAGCACYVAVLWARQGPPAIGDTVPLTAVTTDLSTGNLRAAAEVGSLPDPPGYALWTSPFAAAIPSVAAPNWCTPPGRAASIRSEAAFRHDPNFAEDVNECGAKRYLTEGTTTTVLPPWYRSQGVLGVAAWLVLAIGCLSLLRAADVDTLGRQVGLLAFLAFLPAASSAIVQLFHPQDIVCLGAAVGALAATLRSRWVVAGALFGAALLTKQFAILLLVPALVAAPGIRARLRMVVPAILVLAAGVVPFLLASPRTTLENLAGLSGGGATVGMTVLSLAGVTGTGASAVARGAPIVFAVAASLWAARRAGPALERPDALIALVLACVSSRLVFESVIFPYYLLASSVVFFLCDLVQRRTPHRSLAWSAAAAFFVAFHPANVAVAAFGTMILAGLAVAAGLAEFVRLPNARHGAVAV